MLGGHPQIPTGAIPFFPGGPFEARQGVAEAATIGAVRPAPGVPVAAGIATWTGDSVPPVFEVADEGDAVGEDVCMPAMKDVPVGAAVTAEAMVADAPDGDVGAGVEGGDD